MRATLDYENLMISIPNGSSSVLVPFKEDTHRFEYFDSGTDSADFTSDSGAEPSSTDSKESCHVPEVPPQPETGFTQEPSIMIEAVSHLPKGIASEIVDMLLESDAVANSLDDLRPADTPIDHSFELLDQKPIHQPVRRLAPKFNDVVREELRKMLSSGIITPSVSPWAFPIVMITKKDGKPRFCIDYRDLNAKMKSDAWPMPRTEEIFDDPKGSSVFTTLDLFSGY